MTTDAPKSTYVYVTYIRSTPEKLWEALTSSKHTSKYWFGHSVESSWEAGSSVLFYTEDGRLADQGEIVRCEKLKALGYTWRVEADAALRAEGFSKVLFVIEKEREVLRLTLTHDDLLAGGKVEASIRTGWPIILSGLKSLLETGRGIGFDKH